MRKVTVKLGGDSYPIYIGWDVLSQLGHWLEEGGFNHKVVIITNPLIKKLYGDTIRDNLRRCGFETVILVVPDEEEQKSLETAGKLYIELSNFGAERATPILALGGGVIGDLAGFVAATYLRGVPFIQIPTTLLAQVDSSIGGKVAINYGQIKNKIGAFYQPKLVITDTATLRTLSATEISQGLAEVIKYAVVQDKEFFTYLEENLDRIKSFDSEVLEEIVFRSVTIKAKIVEKDVRDLGLRSILNYGHTIGHAIESASDFRVRHGQAVAIGMLAEGRISYRMGIFSKSELLRLKSIIGKANLPTEIPNLDAEKVIQAMRQDKKILNGKIRFVLPQSIGSVFISDEVNPWLVEQILVTRDEET